MSAVDTNVLLYIHDPRDSRKQRAAVELVSSLPNAVLLWQVACEFVNAVRKLRDESFGPLEAWAELQQLRRVIGHANAELSNSRGSADRKSLA
jgi:predicted nucleic acid-binding protein